jgi:hypothetical protein
MGDPVLRAVGFDIERRLAQVAVVGQPLGDHRAQLRRAVEILPGDVGGDRAVAPSPAEAGEGVATSLRRSGHCAETGLAGRT